MRIENRDLLNMPPIDRLYGTEVEYGLLSQKDPDSTDGFQHLPPGVVSINGFLSNGGRYYSDCNHPEYATPECRTLEEVVIHELAGEQILLHRTGVLQMQGDKNVRLHKRNVDKGSEQPRYWGTHENYLTERERFDFQGRAFKQGWLAHLTTRSVFTGAGTLHQGCYRVAQKLGGTFVEENSIAHHAKTRPLIDTRDEPLADEQWRRIQVSCGDANISPWALRMRLGTTALVLRMVEHGVHLRDIAPKKPVGAARSTAYDHTLRQPINLQDGRTAKPLEVQSELARRACSLGKVVALPDEEYDIIEQWQKVCADLAQNPEITVDRIDWVARKSLLERKKSRLGTNWHHPDLEAHDLLYDQLGPTAGTGQRMRDRGLLAGMPSLTAVETAITTAPKTRAQQRGSFILSMAPAVADGAGIGVNWHRIDIMHPDGSWGKFITLDNPYQHK